MYPLNFDQNIEEGAGIEYIIKNSNEVTTVFKIDMLTEDKNVEVIVFPKAFILNPNETKTVKIYMKAKDKDADGEYSGKINIQTLPLVVKEKDNIKMNLNLNIKYFI